jgi:hypothetical protein
MDCNEPNDLSKKIDVLEKAKHLLPNSELFQKRPVSDRSLLLISFEKNNLLF